MRRAAAWRASVIGLSAILVAVIGLVNMLLVSVAQQTREIGLRRALGATRLAIGAMVLLEALLVCVPGCLVGIGVGAIAARFVGGWAQLPVALPMFWICTSIGVALGVGLLASLIPAWRAAKVDPVVALRQE
jgi:putative ABC transport system permease protein